MKLSKPLLALIIVVIAIVVVLALIIVTYNGLVDSEQQVDSQWAQVENQYQRKIDLIPNLVDITSQYTQFEASTLINITNLRTQWLSALTDEDRLNTSMALDGEVNTIVLAYFAAENYPTLSTIPLVADLMDEIAGTENRIATERMWYNEDVREYNSKIKRFPGVLFAGMFGFEEKRYYDPIPGGV
ncbi:MAG: LemA family protein [Candidatus Thermoplasmatota archaeon]|nr:LemA family protein [Candidatus Thermoplasmatota archaeon]